MSSFRFHKSLPMACIYFFFERFDFFPAGLVVTSILSPIFYVWLLRKRKNFVLARFILFLSPFALMKSPIKGGSRVALITPGSRSDLCPS